MGGICSGLISLHQTDIVHFLRSWLTSQSNGSAEDATTVSPPEEVVFQLQQAIAALPTPQPYADVIREALVEAIAAWKSQPQNNNVLVVLSSPIEPLAAFIEQSLSDWPPLDPRSLRILRWSGIPTHPEAFVRGLRKEIRKQLRGEREPAEQVPLRFSADGVQLDAELRQQMGIVLPELTQCFVRCIAGLEGVLYLRKEILKDPDRFWVVGCNHWAWDYLNYVCQMNSYFDRTVNLDPLNAKTLFEWLAPVRHQLSAMLPQVSLPSSLSQQAYFDGLARAANGSSKVTAKLWLGSLRLTVAEEGQQPSWFWTSPSRIGSSKLSALEASDRHLLFSLLLHNGLQFRHLALSLGDEESQLHARVKELERQGLIEQRGRNLYVNPEYYPSLRATLSGNNFLVGKERRSRFPSSYSSRVLPSYLPSDTSL